jgi:hypothetical protein
MPKTPDGPTTIEEYVHSYVSLLERAVRRSHIRVVRNERGLDRRRWNRRQRVSQSGPITPALSPGLSAERPGTRIVDFDVATALELNLKHFPTTQGMRLLLQAWLYFAERDGLDVRHPKYAHTLRTAIRVVTNAPTAADAIRSVRFAFRTVLPSDRPGVY